MMNPARFLISASIIFLIVCGVSPMKVEFLKITDDEIADTGKLITQLNTEKVPEDQEQKVHVATSPKGADYRLSYAGLSLEKFKTRHITEVAFSAGLSTHQNLSAGQTLAFDTVFTNTGGGYDHRSGIFTCPKAGRYIFHYHFVTNYNGNVLLQLFHNNKSIVSAYAQQKNDHAASGNTVILDLQVNDTVHIQAYRTANVFGTVAEIHGTFSGYLISHW